MLPALLASSQLATKHAMSARQVSVAVHFAVTGTGSCSTPVTDTTIGVPPPGGSTRTGAIGVCACASVAAAATSSCRNRG